MVYDTCDEKNWSANKLRTRTNFAVGWYIYERKKYHPVVTM